MTHPPRYAAAMHPQTFQQSGRDERASVIGHSGAPIEGFRASLLPNPRDTATRRSAVAPEREEAKAPPFELRRIARTIRVPALKAPDGHGMPALLRAGKVVSAQHYDFDELRGLGVELVSVDAEIVPMQPVALGSQGGPTFAEVAAALEKSGMRVVPADAPAQAKSTPEVEQLRAQNEAMQAQLAEMQKTLTELMAKKGK